MSKPPKLLLPPSTATIKADIKKMHSNAIKTIVQIDERDLTRLQTIRASQLPFCPLQYVLNVARGGPYTPMGYYSRYFTTVGTTVHSVLQLFHGASGKFLANWECTICGKTRKLSHEPKCCGIVSKYHEIKIEHKWITGHIDGVFRDSNSDYWILDYKTTSTSRLPEVVKNPGRGYREQVEAYAYAIQKQYGLKIKGVIVSFVTRDNPTEIESWVKELDESDYDTIGKRLHRYYRLHQKAYNVHTMEGLKWAWRNRLCKPHQVEELAGYCMFRRGCEDNDPTEAIAWFKKGLENNYLPAKKLVEQYRVNKSKPTVRPRRK